MFNTGQSEGKPMLKVLKRARDNFFGYGDASVAIPVFDGSLKANNRLETAEVLFEREGLEDLIVGDDGNIYAACGREILRIDAAPGQVSSVALADKTIQAIAAYDGGFAIATADGVVIRGGAADGESLAEVDGEALICVNALSTAAGGKLLISQGSRQTPYDEWSRDLLSRGASGRVIEYHVASGATRVLASGLEYCYGVCSDGRRTVASESWRHRLTAIDGTRRAYPLNALPGYPGRIRRANGGGYWLSVFAARTQLLEFVLREDDYRNEMMRVIEPRHWIAPALSSGDDFREPLQIGSVRQMGILKPWAPPRSYGLVVRLDENLRPQYSLHSRVGGRHHGIVAAVEHDDHLLVLSKGAGRILRLPLNDMNLQD